MFVCKKQGLKACCKFFAQTQNQSLFLRKYQCLTSGIIVTGDEVLKGQVLDTNSYFLCKKLYEKGIKVEAVSEVPDDVEIISSTVRRFSETYDYVLTTGGVGPTHDDVTYEAVGKAFNDKLFYHPDLSEVILRFFKASDKNHPALKMALIPTTAKLTYGIDPETNKRTLYPNISVKNVFMFPGVPELCERLFNVTQHQLFQSHGKFYVKNLYLVEHEEKIVDALNEAVKKYPGVQFGSYPKFYHSYYGVKISLASNNEAEVNEGLEYLKQIIPKGFHTNYDENPFSNKLAKMGAIQDPLFLETIKELREFVKKNSPNNTYLYFDGGKNSTVLLYVLSALYEDLFPNVPVNGIYVEKNPKVNNFVRTSLKHYNLNLLKLSEDTFRMFAQCIPTIAIVKGTRLTDPDAGDVFKYFEGIPMYNPMQNWTYTYVWKIIRDLYLPYCELYDQGYSSICERNCRPNPHLLTDGPRPDITYYKKAFELGNPDLENFKEDSPPDNGKNANGHTMLNTPVLVRSPKLSSIGRGGARCIGGINQWGEELTYETLKKIDDHWSTRMPTPKFDESNPKDKLYILSMFPYPSGYLHLGHLKVYGTADALARYHRMRGKNVLFPMGWDAFGLPAENAALERKVNPDDWTQENISNMKSVMEQLNLSFDWGREFATCDSEYYKWTQFLFIKLYEMGLVYRREAFVNWDPVDKTVLADEQVDTNGRSWRSGAVVEKKMMRQWFIKTTAFAKSLREGLDDPILRSWQDVVDIQKHWIGEVDGTTIDFEVMEGAISTGRKIPIWMKYPEQIHKSKFVAVKRNTLWSFGHEEEGLLPYQVKNPFTNELLPVYLTESVSYAEGAEVHLGIPEEHEEDREFANANNIKYNLEKPDLATKEELLRLRHEICAEARERGIGGHPTSSRLKDWLISRQRYWGTPIPIVHCQNCGEQTVPEKDLPVRLPHVKVNAKGANPLEKESEWMTTTCPKCGGEASRETDTMDTFVDSSWYYLRFVDPDNQAAAFSVEKAKKVLPVDIYVGGKEHASLHLFYARFMNHVLHSLDLVPHKEPFAQFLSQGVVKAVTYKVKQTGEYVSGDLVEKKGKEYLHADTKEALTADWEKMSKSKHNSVQPLTLVDKYSVDLTRLIVLFASIAKSETNFDEKLFSEVFVWQRRLWLTVGEFIKIRSSNSKKPSETDELKELDYYVFDSRNFYLRVITRLYEDGTKLGVALRKMQGLTNSLRKSTPDIVAHSVNYERALALQIIALAPCAPYFASELWAGFTKAPNRLCHTGEILWDQPLFSQPWPQIDPEYLEKRASRSEDDDENVYLKKIESSKIKERTKREERKKLKKLKKLAEKT